MALDNIANERMSSKLKAWVRTNLGGTVRATTMHLASGFPEAAVLAGLQHDINLEEIVRACDLLLPCGLKIAAMAANLKTFSKLLSEGATVAVNPGGLYEQVATDANQERLFFPANLGFVRLAIQHGTPLLPIYCFGENQLFRTAEWVRNINHFLYRKFKVGNFLILGLFGIPVTPLLPSPFFHPVFRTRLHIEFGPPVDVGPKEAEPSDARVHEVYTKYVAALQEMFKTCAPKYLPKEVADRGLEVILRENPKKSSKED
ncbi:DGAT2 [Symbiodinium sp. CCMP2592]|nr:DGAT2 [Symbiodinium sp. CCMP2592]